MLPSFRLTKIAKTVFGSLAGLCLLPCRIREAAQPARAPVPVTARRAATYFRHAAASRPPSPPRLIVYWPSRRTRPLARARALASALLATDRLPIVKPKVPAR
jgi:hypothetical protein